MVSDLNDITVNPPDYPQCLSPWLFSCVCDIICITGTRAFLCPEGAHQTLRIKLQYILRDHIQARTDIYGKFLSGYGIPPH